MKKKYRYFVSFRWNTEKEEGFGNSWIVWDSKITGEKSIRDIERWIESDTGKNAIVILYWRRMAALPGI